MSSNNYQVIPEDEPQEYIGTYQLGQDKITLSIKGWSDPLQVLQVMAHVGTNEHLSQMVKSMAGMKDHHD